MHRFFWTLAVATGLLPFANGGVHASTLESAHVAALATFSTFRSVSLSAGNVAAPGLLVVQAQGRGQSDRGAAGGAERRGAGQGSGGAIGQGRPGQGSDAATRGQGARQSPQGGARRDPSSAAPQRSNRPVDAGRPAQAGGGANAAANRPDAAADRGGAPASARGAAGAGGRASAARGRMSAAEVRERIAALPPTARELARSSRPSERMVVGALARGTARGLQPDAFQLRSSAGMVHVSNRQGETLLELSEDRARNLGGWELRRLGDQQPRGNSPAFCRSGEGHPVWGREWCLDQGFGLGGDQGILWSRGRLDDGVYRRPGSADRVDRGGLIDILGDVVFGRLALHALSMGYANPLIGMFVAEPEGPRLLRVRSGDVEIAEFVDADRNDRFDVLYVAQPRW